MSSNPPQLLHRVGQFLDIEGIRWAAIGALAVAYHGWIRASLDADALISLKGTGKAVERLAESLRAQGWKVELRIGDEEDPLGFVLRVEDGNENQVDLIGGIRRLDPKFFERTIQDELDGMPLRIASPEDLVALKVFAGGPKDRDDAAGVLEVTGAKLDRVLLIKLCARFGPAEEKLCKRLLENRP